MYAQKNHAIINKKTLISYITKFSPVAGQQPADCEVLCTADQQPQHSFCKSSQIQEGCL